MVEKRKEQGRKLSVASICDVFGITRQGLHKHRRLQARRQQREHMILAAVRSIRTRHPEMGVRKLYYRLNQRQEFQSEQVGRDRLFAIMRRRGLLVQVKRRWTVTTNSRHPWKYFRNRLVDANIDGPCQAYVADITYLRLHRGFCYLFLLTDDYSRRIVGHYVSPDLGAEGAVKVLRQAAKGKAKGTVSIHHSDRGIQYSCPRFTEAAKNLGFQQSMTEKEHVYENAKAERVNGILKQEYHLGRTLPSISVVRKMVKESIMLYNQERPHLALNYQTPDEVHFRKMSA